MASMDAKTRAIYKALSDAEDKQEQMEARLSELEAEEVAARQALDELLKKKAKAAEDVRLGEDELSRIGEEMEAAMRQPDAPPPVRPSNALSFGQQRSEAEAPILATGGDGASASIAPSPTALLGRQTPMDSGTTKLRANPPRAAAQRAAANISLSSLGEASFRLQDAPRPASDQAKKTTTGARRAPAKSQKQAQGGKAPHGGANKQAGGDDDDQDYDSDPEATNIARIARELEEQYLGADKKKWLAKANEKAEAKGLLRGRIPFGTPVDESVRRKTA